MQRSRNGQAVEPMEKESRRVLESIECSATSGVLWDRVSVRFTRDYGGPELAFRPPQQHGGLHECFHL